MQADDDTRDGRAWGKAPEALLAPQLSKGALRLFIALSIHADGRSRLAWPTQDTLAKELGHVSPSGNPDRRYVRRLVEELLAADLIRRAGRHLWGDRRWTSRFLVAPFPNVEDDPSSSKDGDKSRDDGDEPARVDGDDRSAQSDPRSDQGTTSERAPDGDSSSPSSMAEAS